MVSFGSAAGVTVTRDERRVSLDSSDAVLTDGQIEVNTW
jgi:hypothetical protein